MIRGQLTFGPYIRRRVREARLLKDQGSDLFPASIILECARERKRSIMEINVNK